MSWVEERLLWIGSFRIGSYDGEQINVLEKLRYRVFVVVERDTQ